MNNKFLSKTTIASLAIITAVLCACTSEKPVSESEILFADPTIFVENGKYYLTGTRENGGGGFQILESDNLENWHYYNEDSTYFILKSGEQTFGDKGFWAPQIYKENGISMSGLKYAHLPYGPVPEHFDMLLDKMAIDHIAHIEVM